MLLCRFELRSSRFFQFFVSNLASRGEKTVTKIDMPPKGKSKAETAKKRSASDDESKASKKARKSSTSGSDGEAGTSWGDFSTDNKHKSGKKSNWTIASWNVNGIRAWMKCKPSAYIKREDPDVFCIQETKCSEGEVPKEASFPGYNHMYWNYAEQKGYSGVGVYSKIKPVKVTYGIGVAEHDKEGRVITAEFDKFYLVTAYVPNSGRGLPRLDYRQDWDEDFRKYLKKLDRKKFVVLCGDLNVAHQEIDLANPKTNKKTAGFTKEEREGFTKLLNEGFVDTFRELYPNKKHAYTFWTYMRNARASNIGWRLDYFVTSEELMDNVCDSIIRSRVKGSDHCPVVLHLAL